MTVSEMIVKLHDFMKENGDLEVIRYDMTNGSVRPHIGPTVETMRVKRGREHLDRLVYAFDEPDRHGAKVCLL